MVDHDASSCDVLPESQRALFDREMVRLDANSIIMKQLTSPLILLQAKPYQGIEVL
jgi:hypothetical protein